MSLKAFHLFFISVSTILALGFAGWCFTQYRADGGWAFAFAGLGAAACAAGLVVYGRNFVKRLKGVGYL